jgi:hypothetical protein
MPRVVAIVAWAGVGKSTLVNHWLAQMAAKHYRSAELIFGWSFYRQGTSGDTSSADEFLDAALTWFGDPDPRLGTAEAEIEASFCAAIRIAREQKSVSLTKRAERTYAEYRRQKRAL